MAYASRLGRARINARSPEAAAICKRCGFVYSRSDLRDQYDWTGPILQNLRVLVCDRCYDEPQEQGRSIVISADPVPVVNPSPEFYQQDEIGTWSPTLSDFNRDFNTDLGGAGHDFSSAFNRDFNNSGDVIGYPNGIDPLAQMPLVAGQRFAVPLSILSILSNGTAKITVNTNGPHGLATDAQVSVEGLTNKDACAASSIVVVTPTQFTYWALSAIPTASLANARTRVITLNVGLPYGVTTIPPIGPG